MRSCEGTREIARA